MTEQAETQLTVQDILDEASEARYHTILEVWREVLKGADAEYARRISPEWAIRVCSSYRELTFADMPAFKERYFTKLYQLRDILLAQIASDDECLNLITPEEDAEINAVHYLNILTNWQKTILSWELDWDCSDPAAAIELAAIADIHRMTFSETGLTALLDQINFQFTDAHRETLAEELLTLRKLREG